MSDWKFDPGSYKGNPALKQRGQQIDFTQEQVKEFIKCSQDPEYFLTNYIKVISLDDGIIRSIHILSSNVWSIF